jgi:hypothetical protein
MVAAVELHRQADPRWEGWLAAVEHPWRRLFVARGLAGLIPWHGYPFADY